ncbi:MAG TPA: NAD(P)-binding domain-containing protein [Blastocatellia bacterium]|nr:NAD(P)-binding domain-containing protein [Blastocatellia bacterium]
MGERIAPEEGSGNGTRVPESVRQGRLTTKGTKAEIKIGIIGSGNIGAKAARLFARAGHEVALSNSRGGKGLEELVAELAGNGKATTIEN